MNPHSQGRLCQGEVELALLILKPDCLERRLSGHVLDKVCAAGLTIKRREKRRLLPAEVDKLYEKHKDEETYQELRRFMLSGLSELLLLAGEDSVAKLRVIKGRTGSGRGIRGEFAETFIRNLLHTPDSPLEAQRDMKIFFPHMELKPQRPRLIIGISGPSESGKSTSGCHLETLGALRLKIIRLLDAVRLKSFSHYAGTGPWVLHMLRSNPKSLQVILGDAICDRLEESRKRICSIESLGDPATVRHLKSRFGDEFLLLFVDAPRSMRIERQQQTSKLASLDEAAKLVEARDHEKELLWKLTEVRDLAEVVINNDRSIKEFHDVLERFFQSVTKGKL